MIIIISCVRLFAGSAMAKAAGVRRVGGRIAGCVKHFARERLAGCPRHCQLALPARRHLAAGWAITEAPRAVHGGTRHGVNVYV